MTLAIPTSKLCVSRRDEGEAMKLRLDRRSRLRIERIRSEIASKLHVPASRSVILRLALVALEEKLAALPEPSNADTPAALLQLKLALANVSRGLEIPA